MKIWKIAGVAVLVVIAFGALGVGMVFAQTVGPNLGSQNWGGMMRGMFRGAAPQATPGAGYGYGMMGPGGMMGRGGWQNFGNMAAMRQWMMGPNGMHTQVLTDLAKALNLSLDELQSQLDSGKTFSEIAQAQGVSQAQLETALETSVKDNLAKAVTAGQLTQQQADQMLSYMDGNYSQMLYMLGFMGGRGGFCPGFSAPTGPSA